MYLRAGLTLSLFAIALASHAEDAKPLKLSGGGEFLDPDGDCKMSEEKSAWKFDLPGVYHDLWPKKGKVNAPRVLQDAEGDFKVEVTIPGSIAAEKDTAIPGLASSAAFRAASLLIWQDENNFVRLDRAGMYKDGKHWSFCYYHIFKDGERTVQESKTLKDIATQLRLERRNGKIIASSSQDDGKTWQMFQRKSVELPKKLKVGVAALNSTTKPLTVEFSGLKVSP
jgi:regulation of enolase protein 1 (concanavalin A-like superfamily)